jgi:hypothetical protein
LAGVCLFKTCDCTKICRANSNFLPTCSTICRQGPLFADKVHYLPSQATICRHRQLFAVTGIYSTTKRSLFCRHVPNAPTFAPLRNISFSHLGTPLRPPPPDVRSCVQIRQPCGPPEVPAGPPTRAKFKMVHYLPTKGSLFAYTVHYLPTKGSLFAYTVHYLPTKGSLFADTVYFLPTKGSLFAVYHLPTLYTRYTRYMTWCTIVRYYFQTFLTKWYASYIRNR